MNEQIGQALTSFRHSPFESKPKLFRPDPAYVDHKGLDITRHHAIDFVTAGSAPREPKIDGNKTPMKNHPIFTTRHATATYCRRGSQKWHGKNKEKALADVEDYFIVDLIKK